jgi:hypothetical protein
MRGTTVSDSDDFVRLKQLHADGVLTDTEYERERARLVVDATPAGNNPGPNESEARQSKWVAVIAIVVASIVVIGTSGYFLGAVSIDGQSKPTHAAPTVDKISANPAPQTGTVNPVEKPQAESSSDARAKESFTPDEQQLISQAERAYADFRMGDGDEAALARHSALLDKLFARHICWGRVDEPEANYGYHHCGSASIQMQPPANGDADGDLPPPE